ncbi:MAG: serine hydrolase domain-containing protein [Caldilineaceae bacterium]
MILRPGRPEEAGMVGARIRHVADLAQSWVTDGLTPALVVLVARRGIVVLHEAYGRLTPRLDAPPLQRDAIYPISSMSKPITATAVMLLVEDGLLGLNRPVCEYIPEFVGASKEAVLVHHLLTHTSGLRDGEIDTHAQQKQSSVMLPPAAETQHEEIHKWLFLGYDAPLWKPPGVEMSYCSYNYELLGEIVRRVSGRALADFAQTRIFAPLGMRDTYYSVPDSVRGRIVKRPADAPWAGPLGAGLVDALPLVKARMVGLDSKEWEERPFAAYGAFSTAWDMATFGQMFLNQGRYAEKRILSPATVNVMTTNQIPGIGAIFSNEFFPEAGWSYGWEIRGNKKPMYYGSLQSPRTFSHGGGGGTYLWVDPVCELVGVYFSAVIRNSADGYLPVWAADLFMNAVTATIDDESEDQNPARQYGFRPLTLTALKFASEPRTSVRVPYADANGSEVCIRAPHISKGPVR